jgi:thiamine-monophosphate kinase
VSSKRAKRIPAPLARDLGETRLIERVLSKTPKCGSRGVIVGPGDDAAVIELGRGESLIFTTDMLIEGTHFALDWSYPEAVGFKAAVANLSDVAAMGGLPVGVVVSIGVPGALPVRAVDEMYKGIRKALALFGGELLGGDTVRSASVTVCVSAIGELAGGKPLLRSGAVPGHCICVTGSLGASELGLRLLKKHFGAKRSGRAATLGAWSKRDASYFKEKLPASLGRGGRACVVRHLRPTPRVAEAMVLSSCGASAAIDISDGLLIDLVRIAESSDVGLLLRAAEVPVYGYAGAVARHLALSPVDAALSSGEEYEILFTAPSRKVGPLTRALAKKCGVKVSVVGEILPKRAGRFVADERGRRKRLSEKGFQHF